MHQKALSRPATEASYKKLCEVIPGGVNSPVRSWKAVGLTPMVVTSGQKERIFDVDGNSYIDYCLSWGALAHGHAHPKINQAAKDRIDLGSSFGITMEEEGQLARKIMAHLPSIEKIRFVSSGTEATMSAVRLARGYTKRDLIVKFAGNFHGHADFFLIQAGSGVFNLPASSSQGIPQESIQNTICLPYNDLEACREFFNNSAYAERLAAVIIEPIAGNMGVIPADKEFLELLRTETAKCGALLIFDEVMCGFRAGLSGAQGWYGIRPDLTTLAKVIGGGFPAAAFGGRKEIMDLLAPLGPVYQSGTLSGNPVAMVAGLSAIELLEAPGCFEELIKKTKSLTAPIQACITEHNLNACVQEAGSMFTLFFGKRSVKTFADVQQLDFPLFAKFFAYMLEKGIYVSPLQQEAWFMSTAHSDESIAYTRDTILQFLQTLKI